MTLIDFFWKLKIQNSLCLEWKNSFAFSDREIFSDLRVWLLLTVNMEHPVQNILLILDVYLLLITNEFSISTLIDFIMSGLFCSKIVALRCFLKSTVWTSYPGIKMISYLILVFLPFIHRSQLQQFHHPQQFQTHPHQQPLLHRDINKEKE